MDLKTLQKYYNQCNPEESLGPNDERNVDIDSLGSPDERIRGENWVNRLARQIELSGNNPVCKYFTGLRGSGKSTELKRLAVRLEDKNRANLLPVLVDAEFVLDLTAEIDIPDIMTALLYGAERRILQAEGKDSNEALSDGIGTRFWNWLTRTDISLDKAEFGLKGAVVEGKLVAEMKTQPLLRQKMRAIISAHLTSFLKEVRDELILMDARARRVGYSGLIMIFDSLEKLQGTSTNWEKVLESAERVFSSDAPYLQLPVHVLYTIPPALALRLRVDVHYLPMIKLHKKGGELFEPGYEAARAIIEKRIPSSMLREILGHGPLESRIRALIAWSGGYPREIIRLLQAVLETEGEAMTDASFQRILSRAGDAYRRVVLASGTINWLATVAVDQRLIFKTDADREAADRMLANNMVLRYLNDEEWFALHPAVRAMPEVRRAIERLEQERGHVRSEARG